MVVLFSLLNSLFSFSFFFGCDGINPREKPWKRGRAPPPQPPQESNNAVYCTYTRLLRPLSYGGRGEMVVRAPHHSKNFFDCLAASGLLQQRTNQRPKSLPSQLFLRSSPPTF